MDFLNGKIKSMYFKYLSAAFGSAMITSIYSIVDMAMVGQYQGPSGTETSFAPERSFSICPRVDSSITF